MLKILRRLRQPQNLIVMSVLLLLLVVVLLQNKIINLKKGDDQNLTKTKYESYYIDQTSPTPTPAINVKTNTLPKQSPTPEQNPFVNCLAPIGSKCEGTSLRTTKEMCLNQTFVCCQTDTNKWELKSKEYCNNLLSNSDTEKVLVTLPHNNKQYYCPKGVDTQAYNLSLEVLETAAEIEQYDPESADSYFLEASSVIEEFVDSNCFLN